MRPRWMCCSFCSQPEKNTVVLTPRVSSMKSPRVRIEQGELEGDVCTHEEVNYLAFKGIPYAKPPLGNLRFRAPEPPEAWVGVRDAKHHGSICPQYNERLDRIEAGSEDCLYLNVYTKTVQPMQPLPVMVWIHGGAFYTGSGNSDFYGPEFLVSQDVILVTFNYRLEVLGFLCLDNEEVPGNAGLKDQVAALKWVKKNISAFGGDPKNVTIFGCSAGAASTSHHLVSSMSNGLFEKAICQSGVCLHEWSYNTNGLKRAFQLGELLGKKTEDKKELLDFLRSVPSSSLVNISLPMLECTYMDITDKLVFGPVIENSDLKVEKFISEPPPDLVRKGQIANVPIIVGYTSGEGIEVARNLSKLVGFLKTVGAVVPKELKVKWPTEKVADADKRIREHYFGNKEISEETLEQFIHLETDKLFAYNIYRFLRYHSLKTSKPGYLYKFTIETERNYTKKQYGMEKSRGVCHSDELFYLFNVASLPVPLADDTRNIIKDVVKLWTNFARTGSPSSPNDDEQWRSFMEAERNCFIIGKKFECVENPDLNNMTFWDDIYGENKQLSS